MPNRGRLTVLIVDDVAVNRQLLSALVASLGWIPVEAASGQECIELCERAVPPDLLLLDIMMPGMNGIETCRVLRQRFSRAELPIIMVTTRTEEESLAEALEAGANDYVSKPYSRAVLTARMDQQRTMREYYRELKILQQRLKLEMVDTFALGVSHNFNNAFGGILGAAELIGRLTPGQDRVQKCVDLIRDAVKSGAALTRKLSSLVRRPTDVGVLSGERLSSLLEAAAAGLRAAPDANLEVEVSVPPELPSIRLAEQQLSDLLDIVGTNAREATTGSEEEGRAKQIKFLADLDQTKQFLMVTVEDNGHGMSPAVLERVFQPFFSTKNLDRVNGVSIVGNGLGLWSAYHLLKVLGGDIKIASREGAGTSVQMLIPLSKVEARESEAPSKKTVAVEAATPPAPNR